MQNTDINVVREMQSLAQGGIDLRRCHKLYINENNKYILEKDITGFRIKIQNKSGRQHRAKYTHTYTQECNRASEI